MSKFYDIHCHVFNKHVVIRRLANVVQSLVEIQNTADHKKWAAKLESISDTLKIPIQPTSEMVYKSLDTAYAGDFVLTPLMMDLTYADDNDGTDAEDKRFNNRLKRIVKTCLLLITILKRLTRSEELKELLTGLRADIKTLHKQIKKDAGQNISVFDDANYIQQLEELRFLADTFPNVKPFYGIDPRQERNNQNARPLIDQIKANILETGSKFIGFKIYAPVGYSPTDPVLMGEGNTEGVYGFCERHSIPITVHCSNGGFATLSTNLRVRGDIRVKGQVMAAPSNSITFEYKFLSKHAGKAIRERANILNHPQIWKKVLDRFPNLIINFAHFGGSGQIMDYTYYRIHENKFDVDDLEESISHLEEDKKVKIRTVYRQEGQKMVLKKDIPLEERKEAWNAMYYAGIIDNWSKSIYELISDPRYPNAYTDLSCFSEGTMLDLPGDPSIGKVYTIREELRNFKINVFDKFPDHVKAKILYGSDYFLLEFYGATMKQYIKDFKEVFGDDFELIAKVNPETFLNIS